MLKITFLLALIAGILLAAIPQLLWLLGWVLSLLFGYSLPYAPFGWSGIGLMLLFWCIMTYGIFVGRFRLDVHQTELVSEELPAAFDGYKVVHISDLHLSTFNDRPQALQRVVDSVNAQEPDLICFTGDLVSMGADEGMPFTEILRQLKAKDGVVSVLGNHDFMIYRRDLSDDKKRQQEVDKLAHFETDAIRWQLLRNQHIIINKENDSICVLGTDNCSCQGQGFHTICAGDLSLAMANTNGFRILLTHDPSHWRAQVAEQVPIALTLSGHTHAGQVRIFGWPLSSVSFHDSEGWIHEGTNWLYVNRGIGCTLPIRLNCPQEITVITLRKAE